MMMGKAEHHVGIHGDEAAVRVVGEAPIPGFVRHRLHRRVVESEIEHGVHHARHRRARPRAHRDQQRIVAVAESLAGGAADLRERGGNLPAQAFRVGLVVLVVISADLGGDGEAWRHRQAEIRHLGKACALAAEEVAHIGAAFRFPVAEAVHPLRFARRFLARRRSSAGHKPAPGGRAGGCFVQSATTRRHGHGTTT